jgi:hypothetical protein
MATLHFLPFSFIDNSIDDKVNSRDLVLHNSTELRQFLQLEKNEFIRYDNRLYILGMW